MNKNQHLLSGAALFICGVTLGNLIDLPTSESDGISQDISQTQIIALEEEYLDNANYVPSDDLPIEDSGPVEPELDLREVSVKRGQGMMDILVTSGAERKDAYKAIKALSQHYDMKKLQIGQTLQAAYDAQGRLSGLNMRKNFDHMIRVNRTDDSFKATLEDLPSLTLTRHVQGVIEDSLFLSAYREGLPNSVIVDMIRIFSFDVDFQREIRKGDRFEIFYERKMSEDGRRVEEGHILYAKLTLRGKPISLYRYKPVKSHFADYFHENGQSAKKSLMRTPIEGARLSSYYGKRKHPVLGYTRMHKGLDFSAPTGTPIMAAGDGIVERASRYGSYGNYVRIRHNSTYKTAYAHLSKYGRGVKAGKRVKQGQIIGYVGATGRVTGRHLHYEVIMNGKQVNPLRLKIPTGITLKGKDRKIFQTLAGDVGHRIMARKQNILLTWNQKVALNDVTTNNGGPAILFGGF
ncbi:MAG: peptidoglycan DD-metalloendopeptidase family protein [Emcibacter sp.]|nr:peptidoglycan DD-metalloendopeptidase family protein [Emcibacter sp.]